MTVINTNVSALNAQAALSKTVDKMNTAMERLSTGMRINSASDDAAGVAIASRLSAEITGINQAIRNAQDGQSMIDAAEGAHIEIENILQRMRELSVQAANDTNDSTDRANLQLEIDELLEEIDRIAVTTTWAGKSLINGTSTSTATSMDDTISYAFQIGSGLSSADALDVEIGAVTSAALGLAASGSDADTISYSEPAQLKIDGNTIKVSGDLEHGDVFSFSLNDAAVSVTYSTIDEYNDDHNGLISQIKDTIDALNVTGATGLSGTGFGNTITTVNNGDGSLTITQAALPEVDSIAVTDATNTAATAATAAFSNGTLTFTAGTAAPSTATDGVAFNVNGIAVSAAVAASDGYEDTVVGMSAIMKAAIETTNGLENVNVVDNGDGSITLTQDTTPKLEAAEVTLTRQRDASLSYDDAGVITVGGSFVEGKEYSFNVLGEEINIKASTSDSFSDTKGGIAAQIAQAINDANISGVSAAKTANANTVTITGQVVAENASVVSGSQFIITSIGNTDTATISISGSDTTVVGSATAASFTAGDSYTFDVAGESFTLTVGADGFTNDKEGVSQQMKELIDAANIEGLTVATNNGTTASVTITRVLTGTTDTTTSNGGSTVVTDIVVKDADPNASDSVVDDLAVTSAELANEAITRVDDAITSLNAQRANLGAVSNRLDNAVANLTNTSTNLASGLSRVQDADFAVETANLTKSQILNQAATAMLAQANASKQSVLSLLQG